MNGNLFLLAGGQGAGKSTLCPELVRLAAGPIVLDREQRLLARGRPNSPGRCWPGSTGFSPE